MTIAALKSHFESPVAAETALRSDANIFSWTDYADRKAPAARETLAGHIGTAAIATYAVFNLAYLCVQYAF
jgi:hypothetical protein